jgi:hypothetical protein
MVLVTQRTPTELDTLPSLWGHQDADLRTLQPIICDVVEVVSDSGSSAGDAAIVPGIPAVNALGCGHSDTHAPISNVGGFIGDE